MFTDKDEEPVVYLHEDALVVKVTLCNTLSNPTSLGVCHHPRGF